MARQKRITDLLDRSTGSVSIPYFHAGQVAKILEIEPWRLQKFIYGKQYRLTPEEQLGKGQGSRRLFTYQDIFRLGIANRLVKDGFAPKFVSDVLQEIEDWHLLDSNETGDLKPKDVGFWRTEEGAEPRTVSGRASVDTKDGPYYVLRLSELIPEIYTEIVKQAKDRG